MLVWSGQMKEEDTGYFKGPGVSFLFSPIAGEHFFLVFFSVGAHTTAKQLLVVVGQ